MPNVFRACAYDVCVPSDLRRSPADYRGRAAIGPWLSPPPTGQRGCLLRWTCRAVDSL